MVLAWVAHPRVLRAGLGPRLSLSKTGNPELRLLSPSNTAAYGDYRRREVLLSRLTQDDYLHRRRGVLLSRLAQDDYPCRRREVLLSRLAQDDYPLRIVTFYLTK